MIQPFSAATTATIDSERRTQASSAGEQVAAHREHKQMRDRKRRGLLRKGERQISRSATTARVHKKRERAVLKFTREIAADPRVGTEQREMPFRPAPRDIGENRQNRNLRNRRSKKGADRARAESGRRRRRCKPATERAAKNRTRGARSGHLRKINAERPTPNVQCRIQRLCISPIERSAFDVRRFLLRSKTPASPRSSPEPYPRCHARSREASKRAGGSSSGS